MWLLHIEFYMLNRSVFIHITVTDPDLEVVCGGLWECLAEPRGIVELTTAAVRATPLPIPQRVIVVKMPGSNRVMFVSRITEIIISNERHGVVPQRDIIIAAFTQWFLVKVLVGVGSFSVGPCKWPDMLSAPPPMCNRDSIQISLIDINAIIFNQPVKCIGGAMLVANNTSAHTVILHPKGGEERWIAAFACRQASSANLQWRRQVNRIDGSPVPRSYGWGRTYWGRLRGSMCSVQCSHSVCWSHRILAQLVGQWPAVSSNLQTSCWWWHHKKQPGWLQWDLQREPVRLCRPCSVSQWLAVIGKGKYHLQL